MALFVSIPANVFVTVLVFVHIVVEFTVLVFVTKAPVLVFVPVPAGTAPWPPCTACGTGLPRTGKLSLRVSRYYNLSVTFTTLIPRSC